MMPNQWRSMDYVVGIYEDMRIVSRVVLDHRENKKTELVTD